MKTILMLAALAEAGTGVILLVYPPIVVRLLFDSEILGAGANNEPTRGNCSDRIGGRLLAGHRYPAGILRHGDLQSLGDVVASLHRYAR